MVVCGFGLVPTKITIGYCGKIKFMRYCAQRMENTLREDFTIHHK